MATVAQARRAALLKVLVDAKVHNEAGEQMVDFVTQNRDALDFANVSRWQLEKMIKDAFVAGFEAGQQGRSNAPKFNRATLD